MSRLSSHLIQVLPDGLSYPDAAQLCLRLYCTVNGVPDHFLPLDKERLGDAFAELARSGWVHQPVGWSASLHARRLHEITDAAHWIDLMLSIFREGSHIVDFGRGADLAHAVGFDMV